MPIVLDPLDFAGENPCVILFGPDGRVASAASYWKTLFSPFGSGQAVFALLPNAKGQLAPYVYTDDVDLIPFLVSFNQHFLGFEEFDLGAAIAQPADFAVSSQADALELHCRSGQSELRVVWRGLGAPFILRSNAVDFGGEIGRSYEVSSVIRAAQDGEIRLNGSRQPGALIKNYGSLPRSAFLALCETWARLAKD
jgi:hypothetical protein